MPANMTEDGIPIPIQMMPFFPNRLNKPLMFFDIFPNFPVCVIFQTTTQVLRATGSVAKNKREFKNDKLW